MQASYASGTLQVVGAVSGTVDGTGHFIPGSGGGGGGGASLAVVLLTDSAGVLFIARDNGTTLSYVRVDTGAAYVPVAPIKAGGIVGAGFPTVEQNVRAGEDTAADTQHVSDDGVPTYISTATTTLVASGRGVLKRIVLTESAAGTISIYDNLTGTGTPISVLKASIGEQSFECGFQFALGLTIVTTAASKLTVVTGL